MVGNKETLLFVFWHSCPLSNWLKYWLKY
uniref:Uncharacterized protein n=1 Tax=Anguilla anguilla TaxID=7936 RepID=A0A0E9PHI2_ANGAN